MKRIIIIFTFFCFVFLFSEDWEKTFNITFSMNLNNYSDNWIGDEVSSFNWLVINNAMCQKQINNWLNISNKMFLTFGQTVNKTDGIWNEPLKSADMIELENIETFTLGFFVDPFTGFRAESFFMDNSDTSKTHYINPITLTESFGIAKLIYEKEKNVVSMRFGGAIKQDINRFQLTDSILNTREFSLTNNGGIEFTMESFFIFNNNIELSSRLILYKALFNSNAQALIGTPQEDYWKMIDVNFDASVSYKFNKHINLSLSTLILYDKEMDDNIRIMEAIGIGISF